MEGVDRDSPGWGGGFVKGANTIALSPPSDTSVTYSAAILGVSNVCYKSEVR